MAYDIDRKPGTWVRARARRHARLVAFLLAAALVLMVVAVFVGFGVRSTALSVPIVVVLYVLSRVVQSREKVATRWAAGARAEGAVGETLNELRHKGYTVMHDIEQIHEGNVDHLVSGPTGVYMIETKSRRYLPEDLRKATRQAAKLGGQLGVWVTAVICIHNRPDAKPFRHGRVWIVPRHALLDWIQTQRNSTLDFERLARFADGLAG